MDTTYEYAVVTTVLEADGTIVTDVVSVDQIISPGWLDGCTLLQFTYTTLAIEEGLEK